MNEQNIVDTNAKPQPRALRLQDVVNIRGAYLKLGELLSSPLATPTKDAEVKGLREFLQNMMMAHADEFVASWLTLHHEYQPLLMGFTGILERIEQIRARNREQMEEQARAAAAGEAEPSNIISAR